ncbi:C-C motif chemokine 3-like [Lagenorhynchus albirostris]|uniref:C-C motif chemokine 3-like n=1 Tax=Lagenorhynchus albirostris TaxID=27610 RepID=UPI0028E6DDFA|nr:C-C motif chemokine 3-like [Lagenorhynchus albirostris]
MRPWAPHPRPNKGRTPGLSSLSLYWQPRRVVPAVPCTFQDRPGPPIKRSEDSSHSRRRPAVRSSQAPSQLCPHSSACLSRIMKVIVATIFVLLCTMTLCCYAKSRVYTAPTCCFTYTSQKIPRRKVVNFFKTSSQCSRPGIIFFTRKGLYICANPTDDWVQEYFRDLEKSP